MCIRDRPEFLSGLVGNVTCGAPLTAIIRNTNTRSGDYDGLSVVPRPGHADYTAGVKYGGHADFAGGGAFSGRLTAPLCIAGGICLQLLKKQGIEVISRIASIGSVEDVTPLTVSTADKPFPVVDDAVGETMRAEIAAAKAEGDSVGGIVECAVLGLPVGPVSYTHLDVYKRQRVSYALLSAGKYQPHLQQKHLDQAGRPVRRRFGRQQGPQAGISAGGRPEAGLRHRVHHRRGPVQSCHAHRRLRRPSGHAVHPDPCLLYTSQLPLLKEGVPLRVEGQLRSFNNRSGPGRRLVLTVYARSLQPGLGEPVNRILLAGTLCKPPIYRRTPLGRSISDLILAVPRSYGRAD